MRTYSSTHFLFPYCFSSLFPEVYAFSKLKERNPLQGLLQNMLHLLPFNDAASFSEAEQPFEQFQVIQSKKTKESAPFYRLQYTDHIEVEEFTSSPPVPPKDTLPILDDNSSEPEFYDDFESFCFYFSVTECSAVSQNDERVPKSKRKGSVFSPFTLPADIKDEYTVPGLLQLPEGSVGTITRKETSVGVSEPLQIETDLKKRPTLSIVCSASGSEML